MNECTGYKTYTFYFNLILYYLILFKYDKSIIYSFSTMSIPVLIIGEIIMWKYQYYKKCKFSKIKGLLSSFLFHWCPFLLFIYLKSNNVKLNKTYVYYAFYSLLLYLLIVNKSIYNIYRIY